MDHSCSDRIRFVDGLGRKTELSCLGSFRMARAANRSNAESALDEPGRFHPRPLHLYQHVGRGSVGGSAYAWIRSKWPQQQLIRPLAVALVFALAFASAIQSQYWASDVSLFSRAVSRAPDNEWAQLNYGSALDRAWQIR